MLRVMKSLNPTCFSFSANTPEPLFEFAAMLPLLNLNLIDYANDFHASLAGKYDRINLHYNGS